MRELKIVNNFCGLLRHGPLIKYVYKFHKLPSTSMRRYSNIGQLTNKNLIMSSTIEGEERWTALHVRETFLDYFKKNGHTFGEINA